MMVFAPDAPTLVAPVEVHAPALPALSGEAAYSAVRVGPEMLRGGRSLDTALRRTPGVSLFRRTDGGAANPTVQGLSLRAIAPSGAGRALVTLDGAPQNDPFGGWVIWSSLAPEGLDGAVIVRGAGAGPYGAGALTGVVALKERSVGGGLQALEISAGERSSHHLGASGGTGPLLLTGSWARSDGYTPVRGEAAGVVDRPIDLEAYSAAARLQGDLAGVDTALRLGAYRESKGAGLLGAQSTASGTSMAFTLAKDAGASGWRVQAWARRSGLSNTSVAVGPDRASVTPANDQYQTPALGYGFNAAWQRRGGPWSWEIGVDARISDGEVRELFRYQNGAFTRRRVAGGRSSVGGVYLETGLDRGALTLTGGARVDAWRQSEAVRREEDAATGAVLLDGGAPDSDGVTPTGRLGVVWRLDDALAVRAAAYAGFRPPTLNELHRPFRVGNDVTEANPTLEPERLYGLEAGVGGGRGLVWNVTAFANRLEAPVTNVTVGAGPATFPTAGFIPAGGVLRQRRNVGHIAAVGLEAEAKRALGPAEFTLAAQLTHAEVDGGEAAPQLTGKRPAQTAEATVTSSFAWRATERLSLAADLRFESERFEDDLNSRRLAPGATLDARGAWRIGPRAEVYLAAENLFGARVEAGETADGVESYTAPRTVRIGLSLRSR